MAKSQPGLSFDRAEAKRWLRRALARRRASRPAGMRARASQRILGHLTALPAFKRSRSVAAFLSFGSEVETDGLIQEIRKRGKNVVIPITRRGFDRAYFVLFRKDDRLERTARGPRELVIRRRAFDFHSIDLVLVPGLGFDDRGHRIGYGGGVYDRLLAKTRRATHVGLFFSWQKILKLPLDPHDRDLDWIVTDAGAFPTETRLASRRN